MDDESVQGEVTFCEDNVVVLIPGPLKEEIAFAGKLIIINESHGPVVEWLPRQQITLSPKPSPDAENIEWGDFTVVGYKVKAEANQESAGKKIPVKVQNPITFDVADLTSFRKNTAKCSGNESKIIASFFLKDGTSIPAFHFRNHKGFFGFIVALEKHVSVKRSDKDRSLYLINDPDTVAMVKSFGELDLFNDDKSSTISTFFKDPYVLMGKFSRVANWWLYQSVAESLTGYAEDKVAEMISETHNCIQIDQEESGYELITCFKKPPRETIKREDPVTPEEWATYVTEDGRMHNVDQLKRRIFRGGIMHSLRSEAWKYLLDYYDFDATTKDNEAKRKQRVDDYYRMKLQWKSISADQESRFAALRERRNIIEKDVSRTDRTHPFFEGENNICIQMLYDILMTYCMFNFDLGYVQGMSDLLSPILVVMQTEADAFWCFAFWMEKIGNNFEMDQLGMKNQLLNMGRLLHFIDYQLSMYLENHESGNLYFAFRWLLILFKRDFKFEEVMRLWEVFWTGMPCKNFHLLICLAILDAEKATIMENNYGLTEILKHINDMAYKLNLEDTLSVAEAMYNQIYNCSQVPDTVQTILGLEMETKVEETRAPLPEKKEPIVAAPASVAKVAEVESPDSASNSTCNTEDYVNIEEQCLYSFGLLT